MVSGQHKQFALQPSPAQTPCQHTEVLKWHEEAMILNAAGSNAKWCHLMMSLVTGFLHST